MRWGFVIMSRRARRLGALVVGVPYDMNLFSGLPGRGQNRLKAVLDSELKRAVDQWDERRGAVQP